MTDLLNDKDKIVVSTIGGNVSFLRLKFQEKGLGFIEQVKKRNDISLTVINHSNRDSMPKNLLEKLNSMLSRET